MKNCQWKLFAENTKLRVDSFILMICLMEAVMFFGTINGEQTEKFCRIKDNDENGMQDRASTAVPSFSQVLETFDLCSLSCKGKSCGCCHQVLNLVPVCGSSYIDPKEKTMEIGLRLAGQRIYNTKIKFGDLEHICQTVMTKMGVVDVCGNLSISDHTNNPETFTVCLEVEIKFGNVKYFVVTFNCLEFKGDIVFQGERISEFGKSLASVRILNPLLLAYEIRRLIASGILTQNS